jgi:hypothetical protein
MLRIEQRLALINGVLLANRVLIFRFQLLTVYVLLVHNCGECRTVEHEKKNYCDFQISCTFLTKSDFLATNLSIFCHTHAFAKF